MPFCAKLCYAMFVYPSSWLPVSHSVGGNKQTNKLAELIAIACIHVYWDRYDIAETKHELSDNTSGGQLVSTLRKPPDAKLAGLIDSSARLVKQTNRFALNLDL